jgi:hypothetical protein
LAFSVERSSSPALRSPKSMGAFKRN